jgi:hypothetical protein
MYIKQQKQIFISIIWQHSVHAHSLTGCKYVVKWKRKYISGDQVTSDGNISN